LENEGWSIRSEKKRDQEGRENPQLKGVRADGLAALLHAGEAYRPGRRFVIGESAADAVEKSECERDAGNYVHSKLGGVYTISDTQNSRIGRVIE
jgi:hypothetical protein